MTSDRAGDVHDRLGLRGTPLRVLLLTAAVLVTASATAVLGLTLPTGLPDDDPLPAPARFGIAVVAFAVAQLARIRFRTSGGMVSITWGEAALIVCLHLVPAGWLPSAVLLGAGGAWWAMSLLRDRRPAVEIVRIAASLAAATALAASVATAIGSPLLAPPTVGTALALVAGAVTYLLVSAVLGGVLVGLRHSAPIGTPLVAALRGKLLMFVGNVAVGLLVVALLEIDARWLLLLPPPLWLLQQTYRHRLKADQEHRNWRAFAEATAALNQLDERGVATAAASGALNLFGAETAEVGVARPDGGWRCHRCLADGQVTVGESDRRSPANPPNTNSSGRSSSGTPRSASCGWSFRVRLHPASGNGTPSLPSATPSPPPCTTRRPTGSCAWSPNVPRTRRSTIRSPGGSTGPPCSARATWRCANSPTNTRWRSCSWTSTSSRRSTTPSGTPPATSCSG